MTEWISVKDRLPEYEKHILIFDEINVRCTGFLKGDDEEFYCHPSHQILNNATHWMPLPSIDSIVDKG